MITSQHFRRRYSKRFNYPTFICFPVYPRILYSLVYLFVGCVSETENFFHGMENFSLAKSNTREDQGKGGRQINKSKTRFISDLQLMQRSVYLCVRLFIDFI